MCLWFPSPCPGAFLSPEAIISEWWQLVERGGGPSLLRCLRNGDLDRPAGVVDLQEAHKDHAAPEGLDTMAAEKIKDLLTPAVHVRKGRLDRRLGGDQLLQATAMKHVTAFVPKARKLLLGQEGAAGVVIKVPAFRRLLRKDGTG